MIYQGGCHCGAITYTYKTELAAEQWPIRADQCSFCRAHAGRTTSDSNGLVELSVNDPQSLRLYRFGQRTADFILCSNCGVYIGATMESAKGRLAVLNVNTLKPIPANLKQAEPVSFDEESIEERTRRREGRWTPFQWNR